MSWLTRCEITHFPWNQGSVDIFYRFVKVFFVFGNSFSILQNSCWNRSDADLCPANRTSVFTSLYRRANCSQYRFGGILWIGSFLGNSSAYRHCAERLKTRPFLVCLATTNQWDSPPFHKFRKQNTHQRWNTLWVVWRNCDPVGTSMGSLGWGAVCTF